MFFGFAKQTEKQPKQIEFRFVSVRTEKIGLFRGHPNGNAQLTIITPKTWCLLPLQILESVLWENEEKSFWMWHALDPVEVLI
jgi:hypothetical protein